MAKPQIYSIGGTVQAGSGVYLERDADQELLNHCQSGEYAYVLTSRQMGKSSLMIATANRLREAGAIAIIIDLTDIGVQVSPEDWYRGFLLEIEDKLEQQDLDLDTDVYDWWERNSQFSITQRFNRFFRDVLLKEREEPIVVFVDEIDTTLGLDFTDDFFIAIRSFFTARAQNPAMERLSFVLIGVATPGSLILDSRRTPFNIGQQVDLTDFTAKEVLPLAAGLGASEAQRQQALARVLDWTGGHPYLTQRLCIELSRQEQSDWSDAAVDEIVEQTFFGEKSEQDNNLQFVRDMLTQPEKAPDLKLLLGTYRSVWRKGEVPDEEQSLVKSHLKLSGVVKRAGQWLEVRNPIYREVFNQVWVREHWPETWWERLKPAMPLIGSLTAGMMIFAGLSVYANQQARRAEEATKRAEEATRRVEREALNAEIQASSLRVENLMAGGLNFQAWLGAIELGRTIQAREAQNSFSEKSSSPQNSTKVEIEKQSSNYSDIYPETKLQAISVLREVHYHPNYLRRNVLQGHSTFARTTSFSPDGQILASGDDDGKVKFWDLQGRELQTLEGHSAEVRDVSFSPDGQTIASASYDGTVKLWNHQGQELQTLNQSLTGRTNIPSSVESVSFSPDGQIIAVSTRREVRLWNLQGQEIQTLEATPYDSFSDENFVEKLDDPETFKVTFSPDGQIIVHTSLDGTIKQWDRQGRELPALQGHYGAVYYASFSPDNQILASASADNTVKLWDRQGRELQTLQGHSDSVVSVSFSPDGQTLASASVDGTIKIWDRQGRELQTLQEPSSWAYDISFSPDGQTLASASTTGTIVLWDSRGRELQALQGHSGEVYDASFSPDGQTIASASLDGTIKLWDLQGRELRTLQQEDGAIVSVNFSPDGAVLASASGNGAIKLWDRNGQELKTLGEPSFHIASDARFSPNGQTIASASLDGTVKLWDLQGRELEVLTGTSDYVTNVSFSPDGQMIAYVGDDNTIKLWDLQERKLQTLQGNLGSFGSVSFSPDGQTLASARNDGTIQLWDRNGRELHSLEGHTAAVQDVSFSPDGAVIASASNDRTIKLWDLQGRELQTLQGHSDFVFSVDFASDGQTIVSASRDGTAIIWNLDLEKLLAKSCAWLHDYMANPATSEEHKKLCPDQSGVSPLSQLQGAGVAYSFLDQLRNGS